MPEILTKHKAAPPSAPSDGYRQIMEAFKTGQTAMVWHHTGSLTEIQAALKPEQFGTLPMPAGPAAHIARLTYLFNGISNPAKMDADMAVDLLLGGAGARHRVPGGDGLLPVLSQGRLRRAHHQEPALRRGGRDDQVRPPAADLRRRGRLVGDGRAAGIPEGAGRARRPPSRPSTR